MWSSKQKGWSGLLEFVGRGPVRKPRTTETVLSQNDAGTVRWWPCGRQGSTGGEQGVGRVRRSTPGRKPALIYSGSSTELLTAAIRAWRPGLVRSEAARSSNNLLLAELLPSMLRPCCVGQVSISSKYREGHGIAANRDTNGPDQNVWGNLGKSSGNSVLPGASAPFFEMTGHKTTAPGFVIVIRPAALAARMSSASSKSASG